MASRVSPYIEQVTAGCVRVVAGAGEDHRAASLPNVAIGKDKAAMPNNIGGREYNARYPRGPLALRSKPADDHFMHLWRLQRE